MNLNCDVHFYSTPNKYSPCSVAPTSTQYRKKKCAQSLGCEKYISPYLSSRLKSWTCRSFHCPWSSSQPTQHYKSCQPLPLIIVRKLYDQIMLLWIIIESAIKFRMTFEAKLKKTKIDSGVLQHIFWEVFCSCWSLESRILRDVNSYFTLFVLPSSSFRCIFVQKGYILIYF